MGDPSGPQHNSSRAKIVRLLISSPGDVDIERQQVLEVVDEVNRTLGRQLGVVVDPLDWARDVYPAAGRPQGVINEQLGSYEIFVGIMWRRFGTPSGVARSGTEEEFLRAYESWQKTKRPHIMFYFCDAPAPPPTSPDEVEQLSRVVEFRSRVGREHPQLPGRYAERAAFKDTFRPDLHRLLASEFASRPLPIASHLLALLEAEKHACTLRDVPFLTPSVLLALLQRDGGVARRSLDTVRDGLAGELRDRLEAYLGKLAADPASSFQPFRWEERDDIARAAALAREAGAGAIGEKQLLLAVLGGGTNTVKALAEWLGDHDFRRLVEIVREQADSVPSAVATPGFTLSP
jgi:hypothetical protein